MKPKADFGNPKGMMGLQLNRRLVLARMAAAHKDVNHLVEHGNAALKVVPCLIDQASDVEAAHLGVVAAAVELGVRAGRHRDWSLAWSLMDAVHNGGVLFAEAGNWDHGFFLDAFMADFEVRDDQLGDAIRELRALLERDREDRFGPKKNPPGKI